MIRYPAGRDLRAGASGGTPSAFPPLLELAATALVGGFDVSFGVVAFALKAGAAQAHFGAPAAHAAGAVAIVSTIELVFGMRYGADVSTGDLFSNPRPRDRRNLIEGLLLVTFARSAQAIAASDSSG